MILFIILGVIFMVLSFSVKNDQSQFSNFRISLELLVWYWLLLGVFSSMFKQIDAGKVGVKSLYGNVQPDILESGLHVINPLLDVTDFDIQTQNYTMSADHAEGAQQGDDAIRVLSNDGSGSGN